jgi:hypothetical protein
MVEAGDKHGTIMSAAAEGQEACFPIEPNSLGAFIGPSRSRVVTPDSSRILHHYIAGTGRVGSSSPAPRNPYLTVVLPVAYIDDLLFHCVVAIGGAHLDSRQSAANAPTPGSTSSVTMYHYSHVLRKLHTAISGLQRDDTGQVLRVLLALVLTASYEVSPSTSSA